MATFEKRKDKWRVRFYINKKRYEASFIDKETAELWVTYKESVIEEINNFEFGLEKSITLFEAIELKIEKLEKNKSDKKTISDVFTLKKDFNDILNEKICMISYNDLLIQSKKLFTMKGKTGGALSIVTILNKLRRLSSVYSALIEDGLNVENFPLKICSYFKSVHNLVD